MNTFFSRLMLTLLLVVSLTACENSQPPQASTSATALTTTDPVAQAAVEGPLVPEVEEVPAGFEETADRVNENLAYELHNAKPFADETMPEDTEALRSALNAVGTCAQPPQPIDLTSLPYPVMACRPTEQGYPHYLIKCNLQTRECINLVDRRKIGTVEEVAPRLTVVANTDVLREDFICDRICIDGQNRVVGAVQPEMQAWLDSKSKDPA